MADMVRIFLVVMRSINTDWINQRKIKDNSLTHSKWIVNQHHPLALQIDFLNSASGAPVFAFDTSAR